VLDYLWPSPGRPAARSEQDRSPGAQAIREYNRLASSTPGVETIILPLGDGLSVSVRE
jgi:predicted O-methyltransferase YrrM